MTIDIKGVFTCASGDSWDWISLMFYKDEKYAVDLMSANPQYCGLTVFQGGEVIYIPDLQSTPANSETALANTSAPWK